MNQSNKEIVLKVGESGLRYSLDQATRELLFLPVPAKARLKAKAYIDVFIQRGAKGLAAILLLPITFGVMQASAAGCRSAIAWGRRAGSASRHCVQRFVHQHHP